MKRFRLLLDLYQARKRMKWSKEKMKKYQNQKLRKLLHFAWNYSDYYSRTFQNAGINEKELDYIPISELPTIDKKILLSRFENLITTAGISQEKLIEFDISDQKKECFQEKYHVVHSSGSTGTPGYFLYDQKAWEQMLIGIIRAALWDMSVIQIIKLLAKKPHIAYIAATDGRYGGVMAVGDGIAGVGAKQIQLDINSPIAQWQEELERFQPDIIIGYPTAIKIVAEQMQKEALSLGQVSRVITCGEPLSSGMRNFLEVSFTAKVINFYGASESLALGVDPDGVNGMLLFDDMNIIEVEDGHMYLTCLYNKVQPLIRYQISDHLTIKEVEKNYSYPLSKAVGLVGRDEDILWFEDGYGKRDFVHPLAIEGLCINGLRDYQFVQISKDTFEINAEVDCDKEKDVIHKEILRQIKEILLEKGLEYVQFYVNFVDEIFPDERTGKKKLVIVNV